MDLLVDDFDSTRHASPFPSVCTRSRYALGPDGNGSDPLHVVLSPVANRPQRPLERSSILDQFGWETADMGKAEATRAIEPLCMLWCLPGFLRNEWSHAFKLLT